MGAKLCLPVSAGGDVNIVNAAVKTRDTVGLRFGSYHTVVPHKVHGTRTVRFHFVLRRPSRLRV